MTNQFEYLQKQGITPASMSSHKAYTKRKKKKQQQQQIKLATSHGDGGFVSAPQYVPEMAKYVAPPENVSGTVSRDRISQTILSADAAWREKTGTSISPEMMMNILQSPQQLPSTKEEWMNLFGMGVNSDFAGAFINNHTYVGADGKPTKIVGKISTMFDMTGVDIMPGMLEYKKPWLAGFTEEGLADWVKNVTPLPGPSKIKAILKNLDNKIRFDLEELTPEQQSSYALLNYGITQWKRHWKNVLVDRGVPEEKLTWSVTSPEWNEYFDQQYHSYLLGRIIPYAQQTTDQKKQEQAQKILQEILPEGTLDTANKSPEDLTKDINYVTQVYLLDLMKSVGGPANGDEPFKELMYRGWIDGRLPGQSVTKARWDYAHEFGVNMLPQQAYKKCTEEALTAEELVGKGFGWFGEALRVGYHVVSPWEWVIHAFKDRPGALGDFMDSADKISNSMFLLKYGFYAFEGYMYAERGLVTFADMLHDTYSSTNKAPGVDTLISVPLSLIGKVTGGDSTATASWTDGKDWRERWEQNENKHIVDWMVGHVAEDNNWNAEERYMRGIVWGADLGLDLYLAGKIQMAGAKGLKAGSRYAFSTVNKELNTLMIKERGGTLNGLVGNLLFRRTRAAQEVAAAERIASDADIVAFEKELQAQRVSEGKKPFVMGEDALTGIPWYRKKGEAPKTRAKTEMDKVTAAGRARAKADQSKIEVVSRKERKEQLLAGLKGQAKEKAAPLKERVDEQIKKEEETAGTSVGDRKQQLLDGLKAKKEEAPLQETIVPEEKAKEGVAPESAAPEEVIAEKPLTPEEVSDIVPEVAKPLDEIAPTYSGRGWQKRIEKDHPELIEEAKNDLIKLNTAREAVELAKKLDGEGSKKYKAAELKYINLDSALTEKWGTSSRNVPHAMVKARLEKAPEEKYVIDTPPTDHPVESTVELLKRKQEEQRREESGENQAENSRISELLDKKRQERIEIKEDPEFAEAFKALVETKVFEDWPDIPDGVIPKEVARKIDELGGIKRGDELAPSQQFSRPRDVVAFIENMKPLLVSITTGQSRQTVKVNLQKIMLEAQAIAEKYGFDWEPVFDYWKRRFRENAGKYDEAGMLYSSVHFSEELNRLISDMADINYFRLSGHLPDDVIKFFLTSENSEVKYALQMFERERQTRMLAEAGFPTVVKKATEGNLKQPRGVYRLYTAEELNDIANFWDEQGILPQIYRQGRKENRQDYVGEQRWVIGRLQDNLNKEIKQKLNIDVEPILDVEMDLLQHYHGLYDFTKRSSLISRIHRVAEKGDMAAMQKLREDIYWEHRHINAMDRKINGQNFNIRQVIMSQKYGQRGRIEHIKSRFLELVHSKYFEPDKPLTDFELAKPWKSGRSVLFTKQEFLRTLQERRDKLVKMQNLLLRQMQKDLPENKAKPFDELREVAKETGTEELLPKNLNQFERELETVNDLREIELYKATPRYKELQAKIDEVDARIDYINSNVKFPDTSLHINLPPEWAREHTEKLAIESGFLPLGTAIEYKYGVRLDPTSKYFSHVIHRGGIIKDYLLDKEGYIIGYRIGDVRGYNLADFVEGSGPKAEYLKDWYVGTTYDNGRLADYNLVELPELATSGGEVIRGRAHPNARGHGTIFKIIEDPKALDTMEFSKPHKLGKKPSGNWYPSSSKSGGVEAMEFAIKYDADAGVAEMPQQFGWEYSLGKPGEELASKGEPVEQFRIKANNVLRVKPHTATSRAGETKYTYKHPQAGGLRVPENLADAAIIELLNEAEFKKLTHMSKEDVVALAKAVSTTPERLKGLQVDSWNDAVRLYAVELAKKKKYDAIIFDIGMPGDGNSILVINRKILTTAERRKFKKEGQVEYSAVEGIYGDAEKIAAETFSEKSPTKRDLRKKDLLSGRSKEKKEVLDAAAARKKAADEKALDELKKKEQAEFEAAEKALKEAGLEVFTEEGAIPKEAIKPPGPSLDEQRAAARKRIQEIHEGNDVPDVSEFRPYDIYPIGEHEGGFGIPATPDILTRSAKSYEFHTLYRAASRAESQALAGDVTGAIGTTLRETTEYGELVGKLAGLIPENKGRVRPFSPEEFSAYNKTVRQFVNYDLYLKDFVLKADSLVRAGRRRPSDFIIPVKARRKVAKMTKTTETDVARMIKQGRYAGKPENFQSVGLMPGEMKVGAELAGPQTTKGFLNKAASQAPELVTKEHIEEATRAGLEISPEMLDFNPEFLQAIKAMADAHGVKFETIGEKTVEFDGVTREIPEIFRVSGEAKPVNDFLTDMWEWAPSPDVPPLRSLPAMFRTKAEKIAYTTKAGDDKGNHIRNILGLPDSEVCPEIIPYIERMQATRFASGKAERGKYAPEGVLDIIAEMENDSNLVALKDMGLMDATAPAMFTSAKRVMHERAYEYARSLPGPIGHVASETLRILTTPISLNRAIPVHGKADDIHYKAWSVKMGRKTMDTKARQQALRHENAMFRAGNDPKKIKDALEAFEEDIWKNLETRGLAKKNDRGQWEGVYKGFEKKITEHRASAFVKTNTDMARAYGENDRVINPTWSDKYKTELGQLRAAVNDARARGDEVLATDLEKSMKKSLNEMRAIEKGIPQYLRYLDGKGERPENWKMIEAMFHSEPEFVFQFADKFYTNINLRYLAWYQSGKPIAWFMKWIDSTIAEHWMRLFKTMIMGTIAFPIRVMAGDEAWRLPMLGIVPFTKRWHEARITAMQLRGGVDPQSYALGIKKLGIGLDKTILNKQERARYHALEGTMPQIDRNITTLTKKIEEIEKRHADWVQKDGTFRPKGPDGPEYRTAKQELKKLQEDRAEFNDYERRVKPVGGKTAMDVMAEKSEMDMAELIDPNNFMLVSPSMGHPDYPAAMSEYFGLFSREPIVKIWSKYGKPTDMAEVDALLRKVLVSKSEEGAALRMALFDAHRIKPETQRLENLEKLLGKKGKRGYSAERYNIENIISGWVAAIDRVVKSDTLMDSIDRGHISTKQISAMLKSGRADELWTIPMTSAFRYGGRKSTYWMNLPARYYQHVTLPLLGYMSRKVREMLFADRVNQMLKMVDFSKLPAESHGLAYRMAEERAAGWVNRSTFTRSSTIFEDVSRDIIPFLNSYRQFWTFWTKMLFTKPLTMGALSHVPEDLHELGLDQGMQIGPFTVYLQSLIPFFLQTAPGEEPTDGIIGTPDQPGLVSTQGIYALPNVEPFLATMLGGLFSAATGGESLENFPLMSSSARSMAPLSRYGLLLESIGVDMGRLARDDDQLHSRWYNIKRQYLDTGRVQKDEKGNLPWPLQLAEGNPLTSHNPDAFIQFVLGTFSPVSSTYSPEFPGTLTKEQAKYFETYRKEGKNAAEKYLNNTKYYKYLYEYRYTTSLDRKIELAREYDWLPNFSSSNYSWDIKYGEPFDQSASKTIRSWEEVAKDAQQERVGVYGGWIQNRYGEWLPYPGDAVKSKIYGPIAKKHMREIRDYARAAALTYAKGNKALAKELFTHWKQLTPGMVDYINDGIIPTWRKDVLMPEWYERALRQDGKDIEYWHPGKFMASLVEAAGEKGDYYAAGYTLPPSESKINTYLKLVGSGYIDDRTRDMIEAGPWGENIKQYKLEQEEDWARHQADLATDQYFQIDVNQLEQLTGRNFGQKLEDAIRDVRLYYYTYFSGSDAWQKANPVGSDGYKRGRQQFYKYKDERMKGVPGGELFIGGAPERLLMNPYINRVKTQFVGPDAERDRKLWAAYMKEARKENPDMRLIESMKKHFDNHLKDRWEDRQKVNDWAYVLYTSKKYRKMMMESYSDYYEGPGNSVYTKMGQAMVAKLEKLIKQQMEENSIFKSNMKSLFDNNPHTLAWHLLDWYNY